MNVLLPSNSVRLGFLGPEAFEPHAPGSTDWAESQFFSVRDGDWDSAVDRAATWQPDVCVVFGPHQVERSALSRLRGLKVGVIAAPLPGPEALDRLRKVTTGDAHGFRWLTYFENPAPAGLADLPLLQTLPLPIDTSRTPTAIRFDQHTILVPEWASPGEAMLKELRQLAPTRLIPFGSTTRELLSALSTAGVVVYSSRDLLGRLDPLPLLALGHGLLLVADTCFPPDWYIEPEDEFLVRGGDQLVPAVDAHLRMPEAYRSVRVRAWQKIREAFDASAAFKRLVHDAWMFGDVHSHLARVSQLVAVPTRAATSPGKVAVAS